MNNHGCAIFFESGVQKLRNYDFLEAIEDFTATIYMTSGSERQTLHGDGSVCHLNIRDTIEGRGNVCFNRGLTNTSTGE